MNDDEDTPWVYQQGNTYASFHERIDGSLKDRVAVHLKSQSPIDGQMCTQELSCDSLTTLQRMDERSRELKQSHAGSDTFQVNSPDKVETIGDTKVSYWVLNQPGDQKEVFAHLSKVDQQGKNPDQAITLNDSILSGVVREGQEYEKSLRERNMSPQERQFHEKEAQNLLFDQQRESEHYILVKWVNGNRDPRMGEQVTFDTAHRENTHRITGSDPRDFHAEMSGEPNNFRNEPLYLLVEKSPIKGPDDASRQQDPKEFSNTYGTIKGIFADRDQAVMSLGAHEQAKQREHAREADVQEQTTNKFHEQSLGMNRAEYTQKRSM